MGHILILDTSCLLEDPLFFLDYDDLDDYAAWIPKPVFEELDGLKNAEGQTGHHAREASRQLEQLLNAKGHKPLPNCEIVIDENTEQMMAQASVDDPRLPSYDPRQLSGDDRLLAITRFCTAMAEDDQVWLTTLDRNLRIRARAHDVVTLDPSGWWQVADNTWCMPMVTRGLTWHAAETSSYMIPMDLGQEEQGRVEIWPYWGYQSGLFSTLHIRLFEPGSDGKDGRASPVLILSTTPQIAYHETMTGEGAQYEVMVPEPGAIGVLLYQGWNLQVSIKRCQVLQEPVQVPDRSADALDILTDLAAGGGRQAVALGRGIGTLISDRKIKTSIVPAFAQLSLSLTLSSATADDRAQNSPLEVIQSR